MYPNGTNSMINPTLLNGICTCLTLSYNIEWALDNGTCKCQIDHWPDNWKATTDSIGSIEVLDSRQI